MSSLAELAYKRINAAESASCSARTKSPTEEKAEIEVAKSLKHLFPELNEVEIEAQLKEKKSG